MYRRFRINQVRDKKVWVVPRDQRLRQVDFTLFFDTASGDVDGWYGLPRQSETLAQMETGTRIIDYGIDINRGRLTVKNNVIPQDKLDGMMALTTQRPGTTWQIWNHRGDRYTALPTNGFQARSLGVVQGYAASYEPERSGSGSDRFVFWSDHLGLFYGREAGGSIFFGESGSEIFIGLGENVTVMSSNDGRRYIAYERTVAGRKRLFLRWQEGTAWVGELAVCRNDSDYSSNQLFEEDADYHSPGLLNVSGRMWMMYLKTKDGNSVVGYRLENAAWLFDHTLGVDVTGVKESLRCGVITNPESTDLGRIAILYINWDKTTEAGGQYVSNVYQHKSTPPKVVYGISGRDVARQGNFYPFSSSFKAPVDSMSLELIGTAA